MSGLTTNGGRFRLVLRRLTPTLVRREDRRLKVISEFSLTLVCRMIVLSNFNKGKTMSEVTTIRKRNEFESMLRMNIRNAFLAESVETLIITARDRIAQGKTFEADCLLELALED